LSAGIITEILLLSTCHSLNKDDRSAISGL
jgi:hypothetical protein